MNDFEDEPVLVGFQSCLLHFTFFFFFLVFAKQLITAIRAIDIFLICIFAPLCSERGCIRGYFAQHTGLSLLPMTHVREAPMPLTRTRDPSELSSEFSPHFIGSCGNCLEMLFIRPQKTFSQI